MALVCYDFHQKEELSTYPRHESIKREIPKELRETERWLAQPFDGRGQHRPAATVNTRLQTISPQKPSLKSLITTESRRRWLCTLRVPPTLPDDDSRKHLHTEARENIVTKNTVSSPASISKWLRRGRGYGALQISCPSAWIIYQNISGELEGHGRSTSIQWRILIRKT